MVKPWLKRLTKIGLVVLVALALLLWIGFSVVVPRIAQSRIRQAIEDQGYGPVRLLRPDVGLYRTTLANLSIGNPDHPQLELASATVTYTPSQLLAGQVDDILLSGLLMRVEPGQPAAPTTTLPFGVSPAAAATQPQELVAPEPPATAAAKPPSQPRFRSARLTNARVQFVDPETGLPTSMLLDAQAKAGANRKMDFVVTAEYGAAKAQVTGTADPGFQVVDADIAVRGITLDPLRPFVPGGIPAKLTEPAELDAVVHVDRANGPRLDLPNLTVRVPRASVDVGNQNRVDLREMVFSVAGNIHRYGSDWYGALTRGPDLTIGSVTPPAPFRPLPVAVSFAPTHARIGPNSWGISSEGAALDIDGSRFGMDLRPFTIATSPNGIVGSLNARVREIELGRNPVIEKLVPGIRQWNISGKLAASMGLALEGNAVRPRLNVRLEDCDLQNTDYELKVQGINAAFALTGISPLRTDVDQTISAKYIQMGKWEIVDTEAKFTMPGEVRPTITNDGLPTQGQIIKVGLARFGWASGDIWCTPFDLNLAQPRIRTELGAKDLDLSKVLWVVSDQKAWAEGLVDMKLWADFSWPELRFGRGWASSRPDWRITVADPTRAPAVILHLPDSAQQLDNWFRMRDPRFQDNAVLAPVRQQVVGTIADFHVDDFRADFSRNPDGKQVTTIRLHGGGRETDARTRQATETNKLDLTIAATDLDLLVSHFLKVKNSGVEPAATTQPTTGKAGAE